MRHIPVRLSRGISHAERAFSLSPRRRGLATLRVPFPFPLAAGALANYLKLTALRPLGFFRTSPYRSKLLTSLYEKSPALRAELQIVCGEGGIRTPGAFQLNSFQDCRNRPLYHLSNVLGGRDCKYSEEFALSKRKIRFSFDSWADPFISKPEEAGYRPRIPDCAALRSHSSAEKNLYWNNSRYTAPTETQLSAKLKTGLKKMSPPMRGTQSGQVNRGK